jgi:hypothetical protein
VRGGEVYGAGELYFTRSGDLVLGSDRTGHYYRGYYQGLSFGNQFREYLAYLLRKRYGFTGLSDEIILTR